MDSIIESSSRIIINSPRDCIGLYRLTRGCSVRTCVIIRWNVMQSSLASGGTRDGFISRVTDRSTDASDETFITYPGRANRKLVVLIQRQRPQRASNGRMRSQTAGSLEISVLSWAINNALGVLYERQASCSRLQKRRGCLLVACWRSLGVRRIMWVARETYVCEVNHGRSNCQDTADAATVRACPVTEEIDRKQDDPANGDTGIIDVRVDTCNLYTGRRIRLRGCNKIG